MKVLVVDNNPVLLKAISTMVQQEGSCEVKTASDGLQALEILQNFTPDLVFTDLVMPLVDGEMLCKILRHNNDLKKTFIVVVSGVPFEQVQRMVEDIDYDLCIVKSGLPEMRLHIREALQIYHDSAVQEKKILATSESMQSPQNPELTLAEEVMLEKKHREEIVAYLSEGVIELNSQGKIVEINDAALSIFEVEKETVIGTSLETLGWGQGEEEIREWLDRAMKKRQEHCVEFNENKPIFIGSKVLTGNLLAIEGTSFFGICIVKDITRLYRAEEYRKKLDNSLRLVKRLEAMSGMAGGVAHDFNNLLTILCGNIEMVAGSLQGDGDEKITYLLDQAKTSAQGAIELARKISAFSPYGIIDREVCGVAELLEDALSRYDSDDEIELVTPESPESVLVSIDRDLMVRALHNVFDNSIEAGGCGDISVAHHHIVLKRPRKAYSSNRRW